MATFSVTFILTVLTVVEAQKLLEGLRSHPNWKHLHKEDVSDCGHSFSNRIIGGHKAKLGQYPWMARIGYLMDPVANYSSYQCGGSLISDRYVLTAAHCGTNFIGIPMFIVQLGELNTEEDPDCEGDVCAPPVLEVLVEELTCHPGFEGKNFANDICLVRLAKPVKFNDYISPICLPTYDVFKNNRFEEAVMEVAGWGFKDFFVRATSTDLLFVKVQVQPFDQCKLDYEKTFKKILNSKQICAGGVIGKDSCGGDSGGPLMKLFSIEGPPRYFLIGIISYGHTLCSATEIPGVYTIVSEYMEWILKNIKE